ncbi:hypothetical protein Ciccas_013758, partial [Cichlidogyrus casuarinus]
NTNLRGTTRNCLVIHPDWPLLVDSFNYLPNIADESDSARIHGIRIGTLNAPSPQPHSHPTPVYSNDH